LTDVSEELTDSIVRVKTGSDDIVPRYKYFMNILSGLTCISFASCGVFMTVLNIWVP
jgi:hypothetical protein